MHARRLFTLPKVGDAQSNHNHQRITMIMEAGLWVLRQTWNLVLRPPAPHNYPVKHFLTTSPETLAAYDVLKRTLSPDLNEQLNVFQHYHDSAKLSLPFLFAPVTNKQDIARVRYQIIYKNDVPGVSASNDHSKIFAFVPCFIRKVDLEVSDATLAGVRGEDEPMATTRYRDVDHSKFNEKPMEYLVLLDTEIRVYVRAPPLIRPVLWWINLDSFRHRGLWKMKMRNDQVVEMEEIWDLKVRT